MKSETPNSRATPSRENYLRAILDLSDRGAVLSSRIAATLGVTKASVSCMMKRLVEEGYVIKERYSAVTLTQKGRKEAQDVKRRYALLALFFVRVLGVDAAIAAEDACRIEHIISPQSIDKIDAHLHHLSKRRYETGQ